MSGEEEIGTILFGLLVLIVMAKVAGLLCEWATQASRGRVVIPGVIGEIVAGIFVGNTVLKEFLDLNENGDFFYALSQLGVIFLLFAVGLETPYSELRKVGRTAFFVALLGVIIPFFGGLALFMALNYGTNEALFVGAAMVATSVGITARVIKDMDLMSSKEARVIIGAAVIDDVLGLIVLSIVVGISQGSEGSLFETAVVASEAVLFVLAIMFIGSYISKVRAKKRAVGTGEVCAPTTPEGRTLELSALSIAIILCLGLSYAAIYLNLAGIVGAFLAGMLFAEYRDRFFCQNQIEAINEFLVPFFFLYVGMQVDLGKFGPVIVIAVVLTIIAIFTKFAGCGLGAVKMGGTSAAIVGSGMFPRGEVAMIVAAIGFTAGVVEGEVYSMVVFMAIATTLASPPMLSYFFTKKYGKRREMKGTE
ncbi:MAG: cation:proton antiporter [Methanomassiliicoccales archaeon]|nr:MAG: cation:proton antiporter [Methanomassiliicoccales archaeon]